MTAGRTGTCPHCCQAIRIGQQIAKVGATWMHSQCAIERQRSAAERAALLAAVQVLGNHISNQEGTSR